MAFSTNRLRTPARCGAGFSLRRALARLMGVAANPQQAGSSPRQAKARPTAIGLCVSLFCCIAPTHAADPVTLAITGGQIVDGTGVPPIADGVVLIAGKRIAAVGPAGAIRVPDGVKIVRADGMTVMPGLIDMHVHLCLIGSADNGLIVQPNIKRMEREILPAGARQYLMNGVTTVRDVGSPIEIVKVRDRIQRGEIPGARLFVSGPLLQRRPSNAMIGWGWHVTGVEDARLKVRELVASG